MPSFSPSSSGVFVISVTPFLENGALDLEGVNRLIAFYLSHGIAGITLLGMMGEAPKLSVDESSAFVARVVSCVGGAVPVVVGVTATEFGAMREFTDTVMSHGAAGVMITPPASLQTRQQIVDHFESVADSLGPVPFVLQDFPLATKVRIPTVTLQTLIARVPTLVMTKHEDWPGLDKITALRALEANGARRVSIMAGNGGMFLPEELARGADGAMTGFAFPEMMVDVCRLHGQNRRDEAMDRFDAYLPLIRYEQQPGIGLAVRKHILASRGILRSAFIRHPGRDLDGAEIGEVERLVGRQASRIAELG